MSDSSTKSEGYRIFIQNASVPSTPLCFYIIFNILLCYKQVTGTYGTIFIIITGMLFLSTLYLTVMRYRKIFKTKKNIIIQVIFILSVFILCSAVIKNKISILLSDNSYPEYIQNVQIEIEEIYQKRYSTEIYFKTSTDEQITLKGVIYYQGENSFNSGDSVFIHKKIYKVTSNDKNDFSKYQISRGIHYTTSASESDITRISRGNTSWSRSAQKNLLSRIDTVFKQPTAGVIKALLTGNQNYIEKKVILSFRNASVLHVLSASGMHVAIFSAIPAFLLIPFFRRNVAMLGSFLFVLFYLYLTDMPVSLIRAVVMFGFFYFQLLLFRKRNVFNYLMLTCSIILLFSPWEIFSPGFQLSFGATGGILIFYKQYRKSLNNLPGWIADTTAVTLSAQIIALPIVIFHMKQLNTAGLISNIIIIPLITIIMGAALLSILLSFISIPSAIFAAFFTELTFNISLRLTDFISGLKLNFYVYDIKPALLLLLLINLIPLISIKQTMKLKFYPVLISVILCTLYLKKFYNDKDTSYTVSAGKSTAEIRIENNKQILNLNLDETADTDKFISEINVKNPDIKIIELAANNNTNLLTSKRILNEYAIEEFRFSGIPDMTALFKKLIFQMEKDNIIVKFY